MTDILLCILAALTAGLCGLGVWLALRLNRGLKRLDQDVNPALRAALDAQKAALYEELRVSRVELTGSVSQSTRAMGDILADGQTRFASRQDTRMEELRAQTALSFEQLRQITVDALTRIDARLAEGARQSDAKLDGMRRQLEEKLELLRTTQETRLEALRRDNSEKLEQMRATVDEKLQKTLEERIGKSFQLVSTRLEEVYKGLGEMRELAVGVGDLKRVLGNVKTRGMLGEVQLGAILEQILAPEQYACDVAVTPGDRNRVEYAVKMPSDDGNTLYLPIDAKFPSDAYERLLSAYDAGQKDEIRRAGDTLESTLKQMARSIRDKYIAPPHTTDFGILFLPTEGLYAEAVRRGLIETLQRDHHILLAGPTTMAALLNSLQMGFRTLALQKRSSEVWQVLGAVKTEFSKFQALLTQAQKRIEQAGSDLDQLVGVRTRQIERRLRQVEELPETEAQALLEEPLE